jgi:hypothetical protein
MTVRISCDLVRAAQRSEGETSSWSDQQIRNAVLRYERFLGLIVEDLGRDVAPTRDIDAIWHLHMQSPRAYFKDCLALCGDIIDHDGGFGHTAEEWPELLSTFDDTAQRWEKKYGEPYAERQSAHSVTKCTRNCVSRCQRACKAVVAQA